jgi:hypothetical protein
MCIRKRQEVMSVAGSFDKNELEKMSSFVKQKVESSFPFLSTEPATAQAFIFT